MSADDDDRPTVVLDLNALKKQKLKQEEDLANIVQDLEFSTGPDEQLTQVSKPLPAQIQTEKKSSFRVILFDFQSDFFKKSKSQFPSGFEYKIAETLPELNKFLASKNFQIVVFNYDVNPKAVNQLTTQIKKKFPSSKTLIMARAISPEKAQVHAKTPAGANGYCQFPVDAQKIAAEFSKIEESVRKVS